MAPSGRRDCMDRSLDRISIVSHGEAGGVLPRRIPWCEFYRVVDLRRLQVRRRQALGQALAAEAMDSAVRHLATEAV